MPTDAEYLHTLRAQQPAEQSAPIPVGSPSDYASMQQPQMSADDLQAVEMAERYNNSGATIDAKGILADRDRDELADVATIMRSDNLALQERIKTKRPELFEKYEVDKKQKLKDVGLLLSAGTPEQIQALRDQRPELITDYHKSQRNFLVKAAEAVKDWAYNTATGKYSEGYGEVPPYEAVDTMYATADQAATLLREAATPSLDVARDMIDRIPDPEANMLERMGANASQNVFTTAMSGLKFTREVARLQVPEQFRTAYPVGADVFGNPLIALEEDLTLADGKVIAADTPLYPNKPGMSQQDMLELQRASPEILAAAVSGGQSFLAQLLINATAATGVSAARQTATELEAPSGRGMVEAGGSIAARSLFEGGISIGFDLTVTGGTSLLRGAAHGLVSIFKKAAPDQNIQRFVSIDRFDEALSQGATPDQAFEATITAEGRAFMQERQITADQFTPELLTQMIAQARNPQAFGLDAQYASALSRSFQNSIVLSEFAGKLDPKFKEYQAAEAALLGSRSPAGAAARDRFAGDVTRLKGAAEAQSGVSFSPSAEFYDTAFDGFSQIRRASYDAASKKMDNLLETLPQQGHGQSPIRSDGILTELQNMRKKYAHDPKYQGDLDTLEARLYEFGVLDTPAKTAQSITDRVISMDAADNIARQRIETSMSDRELRNAVSEYEKGVRSSITSRERTAQMIRQGQKRMRGQEFTAEEQLIAARERGVAGSELSDLERSIDERLDRFSSFQGREVGIQGEGAQAAQQRRGVDNQQLAGRKAQQLAELKERKIAQFNELAALRQQKAVEDIQRRAGAANFDTFTLEAGIRLNKAINQSKLDTMPYESVAAIKKALSTAIEESPADDVMKREFKKSNKRWNELMTRWDDHLPAARIAEAISKNNAGIGNLAASGIVQQIKSAPKGANVSMMRALRQARLRGNQNAPMIEKNLRQVIMADLWNDIFERSAKKEGVGAATLEGFEKALHAWGPNVPTAMGKLGELLTKEQSQVMRSMHQLLQSQRRRPINGLTADQSESMFRTLWKQLSNSVWLAIKTPGLAAGVTTARFTATQREQVSAKALSDLVMNPHQLAERRLKVYTKDPLRYQAGIEGQPAKGTIEGLKIQARAQGVPFGKMTPEQRSAFHDSYAEAFPALHAYQMRETNRLLRRRLISTGAREMTTN